MRSDYIVGIMVHRQVFLEVMLQNWSTAPVIEQLSKLFGFKSFTPPTEGSWGFDDSLSLGKSAQPEWILWEFKLPKIRSKDGVGESSTKGIAALRCSLHVLFLILSMVKEETNSSEKQLIVIDSISLPIGDRRCSGSIDAVLTPTAISWLSKQPTGHIEEIVESMKRASEYMWEGVTRTNRFGAECDGRFIYLDIPGEACHLYPENNHNPKSEEGYSMSCHNTDSSLQQLTFLVGLARLHVLMRHDDY